MQLERKRFPRWNIIFKTLAWYQIIGGAASLAGLAWFSATTAVFSHNFFFMTLIIVLLNAFSVYAGLLLLRRSPVRGLSCSFINQLLQTVHIGWGGFIYKHIAGICLSLTWFPLRHHDPFSLEVQLSRFLIYLNNNDSMAFISINLMAVVLAYLVMYLKDAYAEVLLAKEITDVHDIGHN